MTASLNTAMNMAMHTSPEPLGPGARHALMGTMLGAHLLAGWALLQRPVVHEAVVEAAPIMVELIAPAPVAPTPVQPQPPAPAPEPRPMTPPPAPAPVLAVRPTAAQTPSPPMQVPPPIEAPVPPAPAPPAPVPVPVPAPVVPVAALAVPAAPVVAPAPAPVPAAPRTVVLTDSDWVRVPEVDYPAASRQLREEGTVVVRALIDTRGVPKQVVLQRSSKHPRLDQAALRAAMGARVKPRTDNGVPFEFWIAMPLAFELED